MRARVFEVEKKESSVGALDINSGESGEALRKVGQQIGDDLAAMPLRARNPRDVDQIIFTDVFSNIRSNMRSDIKSDIWANARAILFLAVAHSRISRTKRFLSFVPEALRTVRIARAVRPCLPMTFPRSPSATRNSSTVA